MITELAAGRLVRRVPGCSAARKVWKGKEDERKLQINHLGHRLIVRVSRFSLRRAGRFGSDVRHWRKAHRLVWRSTWSRDPAERKNVIVGYDPIPPGFDFRVARYNPDGTRATTFPETKQ